MSLLNAVRVYTDENGIPATGEMPEIETDLGEIIGLPGTTTIRAEYDVHDVTRVTITFFVKKFEQVIVERDHR